MPSRDAPGNDRIPFLALLSANAISQLGSRLSFVAIPWFVLVTTGSPAKTGLVGFFTAVPLILSAFFGGSLVGRLGYKSTSVLADLTTGLAVAAIPALYHTVGLAFWQLLLLVLLRSVLGTPGDTARQSLFPDLAELAGVRLERANAALQSIWRLSFFIGPPLAGLLIALLGVSNVLWLDAASFAASALLIGSLVPSSQPPATPEPAPNGSGRSAANLLTGLRLLRADRLMLLLALISTIGNALGAATFDVVLPVYARHAFGSAESLGLMLGGFGGGALLSAVAFGAIGYRLPLRTTFIGALILSAIPYWIIATMPPLAIGVAALALDGLSSGPFGPIVQSVYQARVPAGLRGPFFGTMIAVDNATTPLAIVVAGLLLDRFSLGAILVGLAIASAAVPAVAIAQPALRDLDAAAIPRPAGSLEP